jgi:hypothetical protein
MEQVEGLERGRQGSSGRIPSEVPLQLGLPIGVFAVARRCYELRGIDGSLLSEIVQQRPIPRGGPAGGLVKISLKKTPIKS